MAILVLHKVTLGAGAAAKTYYCLLNPTTYTSIDAVVGISKVTEDSEKNSVKSDVAELIGAGVLFRIVCYGKSSDGKRRSFNILCTREKIGTALDGLEGKTIHGVTVGAGRIKRTATFY